MVQLCYVVGPCLLAAHCVLYNTVVKCYQVKIIAYHKVAGWAGLIRPLRIFAKKICWELIFTRKKKELFT